jgi:hypothetical protein
MSGFIKLPTTTALSLWNNFISSMPVPVPFSFNPSLFFFFQNYFHWKPWYFFLYSEEKLVAVFPMVNTGKRWVSLPHFSYGGLLTLPYTKIDTEQLTCHLITAIKKEKAEPGFFKYDLNTLKSGCLPKRKVYLRSMYPLNKEEHSKKVSSFLLLSGTCEEHFQRLSSNLRRKIRKTEKEKITVISGKEKLLDDFYSVYRRNMHRLGSPAYGKSFFRQLLKVYDYGEARLFVSCKQQVVIGAALLFSYNGFWENAWFSTCRESRKDYVSDHLHWEMIQYAIQKKAKIYSFGRSNKDGTVYRYKNHWPVVDRPLYEYTINPSFNVKNQKWLSFFWQKLPYLIAYRLGPTLIKHIY